MIRPLTQADREDYLAMCREFYHSDAVLAPVPDSYFERTFAQLISGSPYAKGLMLEEDGQAVGYCLLAVTWSQEAGGLVWWQEELYIRPAFQSRGLGSAVLRYLRENRPQDVTRFRLELEPENQGARRLYRHLGYRDLGYDQMAVDFPQ